MRHGSLFSGIGGFDLAAEWMGWENVFHCEWNEFGQRVLKYYWPNAISYGDITKTDFTIHRGRIDIITGGFPCQPYSLAGKRKGKEDERHLWPEMLRAIREIQPSWVVGENVPGIVNWSGGLVFHEVQTDLEAQGYEVFPCILPACGVNAPHRRERVWFIAHNNNARDRAPHNEINGHRQKDSEQWQQSQSESCGYGKDVAKRINANPSSNGVSKQNRKDDGIKRKGIAINEQINGRQQSPIQFKRPDDVLRLTSDTEGLRINRTQEHEDNSGQGGERRRCDIDNTCEIQGGDVTSDTCNQGLQGRKINGNITETKGQGEFYGNIAGQVCHRWEDFPTQPPLCSRNDGVSTGLSGITFSKHRNESIKAYGNAIVPQIAFQIFKAIEAVNNFVENNTYR